MKTLSIRQPWASMICAGIKDVENRTWKTKELPGRILIHASSAKVTRNFFNKVSEEQESIISNHQFYGNLPQFEDMPTSAIIGYATVEEFVEGMTDSVWDGGIDQVKWRMKDAWLFDKPILNVKGKLHLFDYDLDENNLPPAHQVELAEVCVDEDHPEELIVPVNENYLKSLDDGEYKGTNIYVTDDNIDILGDEGEYIDLKPFKTICFEGESKIVKYELTDNCCIFPIVNSEEDPKPCTIQFHDGTQGQWLLAGFEFGKKLETQETVSFCGRVKIK